jgi:hypothetical protein
MTMRQVAHYADAANFGPGTTIGNAWTPEDVRRKYEVLRQHCATLGRPFDSILRTHVGGISALGDRVERQVKPVPAGIAIFDSIEGTPGDAVDHYRTLIEVGVQYFIIVIAARGNDFEILRLFAEKVMPELTTAEPEAQWDRSVCRLAD